jgi:hypothetical protein
MELRDHAKRSACDMREARDRAKIAHRKGDNEAEIEYRQVFAGPRKRWEAHCYLD